jgi:carboxymethylenebutenolidase
MRDKMKNQERIDKPLSDLSRRKFVTASVAAGLGAAAPTASNKALPVIEADDDQREPEVKDKLKAAFAAAKAPAEIEVYPNTPHGWCVPADSRSAEHKAAAERAWSKLITLFKSAL